MDLAAPKSIGDGGTEYFSAIASADDAHARKEDTAALISGVDLKCGWDLFLIWKDREKGEMHEPT